MATLAYYAMSPAQREKYSRSVRPEMRTEEVLSDACCRVLVRATLGNELVRAMPERERSVMRWRAVKNGHLECARLFCRRPAAAAADNGRDEDDDDDGGGAYVRAVDTELCVTAAERGHLPLLRFLREQGFTWDETCARAAAAAGSVECLRYARENGCPWDAATCQQAASRPDAACLRYARENGCPWNGAAVVVAAAAAGSLQCLRYARDNGCPWHPHTCRYAAARGHLECLRYAVEHGCPYDSEVSLFAAFGNQPACLEYALSLFDHDLAHGNPPGHWSELLNGIVERGESFSPPRGLFADDGSP